jgi:hypothetical protein
MARVKEAAADAPREKPRGRKMQGKRIQIL